MKYILLVINVLFLVSKTYAETPIKCNEMELAANAITKINGGDGATSPRIPGRPIEIESGYMFEYTFDAMKGALDSHPDNLVKIGNVEVKAYVKYDSTECKITSVNFTEQ